MKKVEITPQDAIDAIKSDIHGILRPETPLLAAGRKAGSPHARTAAR